jgi:hypothetical protein
MSVETVRRVVCDECGKDGPTALESEDPVALAKAKGWREMSCGDHLCPDCCDHAEREVEQLVKTGIWTNPNRR